MFSTSFLPHTLRRELSSLAKRDSTYLGTNAVTGTICILAIFTIVYFWLTVFAIVRFINARGHRRPVLALVVSLALSTLFTSADIVLNVISNIDAEPNLPATLFPAFVGIVDFANWFSTLTLYWSVLLFIHDRTRAAVQKRADLSGKGTESTAGTPVEYKRTIWIEGMQWALLVLLFVLSTITNALDISLQGDDDAYDFGASAVGSDPNDWPRKYTVYYDFNYAAESIYFATAVEVVYSTWRLWKAERQVGFRDVITRRLMYIVTPLYAFNTAVSVAFVIVYAKNILPKDTPPDTYNKLNLVVTLVQNLLVIVETGVMVAMCSRKIWGIQSGKPDPEITRVNTGSLEVEGHVKS